MGTGDISLPYHQKSELKLGLDNLSLVSIAIFGVTVKVKLALHVKEKKPE